MKKATCCPLVNQNWFERAMTLLPLSKCVEGKLLNARTQAVLKGFTPLWFAERVSLYRLSISTSMHFGQLNTTTEGNGESVYLRLALSILKTLLALFDEEVFCLQQFYHPVEDMLRLSEAERI